MLIGDLFPRSITRAIPPVVYFHEQAPAELAREVSEYIITGGYPKGSARATEDGIHEQLVTLLEAMGAEMDKPGGPELPASWISGFYGSGKSSFAKLLGLALDGRKLPDGTTLADALLAQDHSPGAGDLKRAWELLLTKVRPLAVVFDVGSRARDAEHVHAVVVRVVQKRFGYSATSALVADHELKLELEKLHPAFMDKVRQVHGKPWTELKDSALAEDYFSAALHALQPELYRDPMSWVDARSGSRFDSLKSVDEAASAIADMRALRYPNRTLFIVVDEVSQYVHTNDERMLALQSFVSALGQRMKGNAWLLATGQQRLEEGLGPASSVVKMKDRFPSSLRVHLGIANIRDVVHKRLLRKHKIQEDDLRVLYGKHREALSLYAYKGEEIEETAFVEIYPLLPGHVELLLDITSGLRARSQLAQQDSYAVRGLLQLLGDIFRDKELERYEVGHLITVDMVYDALASALSPDVQSTIHKALAHAKAMKSVIMERVVKAVAMLALVQGKHVTTADLVARCLHAKLGDGTLLPQVQAALDALVGEGLVARSETKGYTIESSAGQDWQKERDAYNPTAEEASRKVQEALAGAIEGVAKTKLESLDLPWLALYSDNAGAKDRHIKDERKPTVVTVDFQLTRGEGRDVWVPRSDTPLYRERIVWVAAELDAVRHASDKVLRSERMVERYQNRHGSDPEKQTLVIEEQNRLVGLTAELDRAVKAGFMSGQLYFRGRDASPREHGATFDAALLAYGTRAVADLYPNPTTFSVPGKDIQYLIENKELVAPPTVLGDSQLGILSLDAGRYEVTCAGRLPQEVLAYVRELGGVTGATVLAHFGGPPHGVPSDTLRAVVVGLLRAGKVRVEIAGKGEITSAFDEGARELLSDGGLRKARLGENTKETLQPRDRAAICTVFKDLLGKEVARDNDAITDAVVAGFAQVRERLTVVATRFRELPKSARYPAALGKLETLLERCRADRRAEPTVMAVKRALTDLRDGLTLLRRMEDDLTDAAIERLRDAESVALAVWPALEAAGASDEARASAKTLADHLASERPWEDTGELAPLVVRIREEHRGRRRAALDAHESALESLVEKLKRRPGFDRLDVGQRHEVLRHLREGAAAGTDDRAVAPSLAMLDRIFAQKRDEGFAKALAQLDALRETAQGERAMVEVRVDWVDREIDDPKELERLFDELRARVAHELAANHRVRLK